MVKASELLEKIKAGAWEAIVENDGDCYPQLFDATLSAEDDGSLSLAGWWGYREDSARYGVSLGQIVVDIDGVKFTAERIGEGELDTWEITGDEIEYDADLTPRDLTEALEAGDLPHYDCDDYEFEECGVTARDLIDVCSDYPDYLAKTKDGEVRAYKNEEDIPDDAEPLDYDTVIEYLFDAGKVSYDCRY